MTKNFKRKRKIRHLKKTYLIVCEGATEEIYFKGMKRWENLRNVNVKVINPQVSTPFEILAYARREVKEKEYDAAFCVIDGDVLEHPSTPGMKQRDGKVRVIMTIPCFELWLLLHHKYTNRDFMNCRELITRELKNYWPGYEKSKAYHNKMSFYENLKDIFPKAVYHAKRLEAENQENKKTKGTGTGVYRLIETILDSN